MQCLLLPSEPWYFSAGKANSLEEKKDAMISYFWKHNQIHTLSDSGIILKHLHVGLLSIPQLKMAHSTIFSKLEQRSKTQATKIKIKKLHYTGVCNVRLLPCGGKKKINLIIVQNKNLKLYLPKSSFSAPCFHRILISSVAGC